ADFFQELVAANPVAGLFAEFVFGKALTGVTPQAVRRLLQEISRIFSGVEKGFDTPAQSSICPASRIQTGGTGSGSGALEHLCEYALFNGEGHYFRLITHT